MHEVGFATTILEEVKKEAKKQNALKVTSVELVLGELTLIDSEQLIFLLNSIIQDDIIKGADFKVKKQRAEGECSCGYSGPLEYKEEFHQLLYVKCPRCDGIPKIKKGDECVIEKINMEVEERSK